MSPSKPTPLFLHLTTTQVREFAKIKSEHDLRLKVKDAFFGDYSVDVEDERIDFLVYHERTGFFTETFLWAESKDKPTDTFEMFAQLLLTIKKKADTEEMPPKYLGVFDREKIAFTEYGNALPIFNLNDFNWNERPSSVSKKTINQVAKHLKNVVVFNFEKDTKEILEFLRENFMLGKIGTTKVQINKNNFIAIYNKWVREVLPSIGLNDQDWKDLKKKGVGDCEFYLADLLSEENKTISDKLNIMLQESYYKSKVKVQGYLEHLFREIPFNDKGKAHTRFWARYERPPKEEYHRYMIERRDLLVPQNIRERKGAYYTPQIWVEKSQEYLAKVFGENWQEEYYVWDCCAGTCNLLVGLAEKHRVWASTIDQPDVDIVHELIERKEFNLLAKHVFQFDFLHEDFSKLPKALRDIINDPEKRERLIIYMNPPYAEAGTPKQRSGTGKNKEGVATTHQRIRNQYELLLGKAVNEVFALFFIRIIKEIPGAKLASFSTLKYINSQNFTKFRDHFLAEFKTGFVCPANTFDNVQGKFPIGFLVWDTSQKKKNKKIRLDAFDRKGYYCGKKTIHNIDGVKPLTAFTQSERGKNAVLLGHFAARGCDFQNQGAVFIDNLEGEKKGGGLHVTVSHLNLIDVAISFTVRHCIEHTWLNDRDQFLYPNEGYKTDKEFQNDCLVFVLFHGQNRIRSNGNANHWIPFTAKEVDARENFQSTFMSDFLAKRKLSNEAKMVFEAGKALWKYYHETIRQDDNALTDASLYEIREYFKGRDEKGRMKNKATDEQFNELEVALRSALKILAEKIQPKVYEYGFLKK